jgi:cell division protein ZapA
MAALNLSNELALANQTLETNQQQLNSLVSSLNDALTEK